MEPKPRKSKNPILAIHRRLLPNRSDVGWTPYLWLVYLVPFVYQTPFGSLSPGARIGWIASLAAFFALYFHGYWRRGTALLWNIAGLTLLGLLLTPFSGSALVFFIYAAGFTGAVGPPRVGVRVLAAISAVVAAYTWFLEMPWLWMGIAVAMCWVIGATNIYYTEVGRKNADLLRTREEVRRLATLAERERIARDLHDLLGHTLSLITMKAELARKLSERGDDRAAVEIADVERISRDALRQVREAVEGFREVGLAGEMARARIACDARGIELEVRVASLGLDARQEAALAMVLREAVTNVARHSFAERCSITLDAENAEAVLRVIDDGRGGTAGSKTVPGNGLTGMEDRLRQLGGRLTIDGSDGWRIEARLPLEPDGVAQRALTSTAETLGSSTGARPVAQGA